MSCLRWPYRCVTRLNLELFKARDVMHRPVITITPRESLSHLARLLLETSHGGFPVVKYYEKTRHEVAYGLLTRYDVVLVLLLKSFLIILILPYLHHSGWTNQVSFQHKVYPRLILHCIVRKFRYLQNMGTFLWSFVPNHELSWFFCFFAKARQPSKVRVVSACSSTMASLSYWVSTFVYNTWHRASSGSTATWSETRYVAAGRCQIYSINILPAVTSGNA